MQNIARSLGFVAPHVAQSMYIFKVMLTNCN